MKQIGVILLLLAQVVHGQQADARSSQSKLPGHGIQVAIPNGWELPAAVIGAHLPKIQDGKRTVLPIVREVYLSPKHSEDWGELELTLYDIDARSWLGAMVLRPEKWLPVRGDMLLTYFTSDKQEVTGALIPFGNTSAVKFRVSRTQRGLGNHPIKFTEDLFYSACGGMLIRIQMRSDPVYFDRFEASLFKAFEEQFICARLLN
ncbi:MAG: hypothetical protein MRJ68_11850 [Nitrospira sp.]|nr:hypothetical protein [Nitrospira sp.]